MCHVWFPTRREKFFPLVSWAPFTQDTEHLATCACKLWNTLQLVAVLTQVASNIKRVARKFVRKSACTSCTCVNGALAYHLRCHYGRVFPARFASTVLHAVPTADLGNCAVSIWSLSRVEQIGSDKTVTSIYDSVHLEYTQGQKTLAKIRRHPHWKQHAWRDAQCNKMEPGPSCARHMMLSVQCVQNCCHNRICAS